MKRRGSPSGSRKRPVAKAQAMAEPRGRPGGRSARVGASVLRSAFDVLVERGSDAFTIAEVAERSGVHETTIYRRWETKNALAREACLHHAEHSLQIPDTGALRSDLAALLKNIVALIASPQGQAMLALGSIRHPHVVAVRQAIWQQRLNRMRTMLDKAVARGEFPGDADPEPFLETLIAPLYLRAQVTAEPLEAWRSDEMIDRLLAAYPVSRK